MSTPYRASRPYSPSSRSDSPSSRTDTAHKEERQSGARVHYEARQRENKDRSRSSASDTSYYNDASSLPEKGTSPDIIVLGAGASGLMAAFTAAQNQKRVLLIDHGHRAGRKVLIAGGGRCNFTNTNADASEYVGEQAVFCRSALSRFTPWDMVAMLESQQIPWEEREHGELFCSRSAEDVRDMLVNQCRDWGCWFAMGHSVKACRHNGEEGEKGLFTVETDKGNFSTPRLLIAMGSPAWEQIGATDMGHRLAKSLGHHMIATRPVLVPLTMPPLWPLHGLQGISLKAAVSTGGHTFVRDMLFTHRGLSGPAILSASCHWKAQQAITINFLPDMDIKAACESPEHRKQLVRTMLARLLPTRLAERLNSGPLKEFSDRKAAELSKQQRQILADTVHAHSVVPSGTEGLRRAEAAAGGIDTKEVNPKTMESRKIKGLFFAGEILDVTGHLGGYNLHWAWASGRAAGEAL